jgi:hypothetical protein
LSRGSFTVLGARLRDNLFEGLVPYGQGCGPVVECCQVVLVARRSPRHWIDLQFGLRPQPNRNVPVQDQGGRGLDRLRAQGEVLRAERGTEPVDPFAGQVPISSDAPSSARTLAVAASR